MHDENIFVNTRMVIQYYYYGKYINREGSFVCHYMESGSPSVTYRVCAVNAEFRIMNPNFENGHFRGLASFSRVTTYRAFRSIWIYRCLSKSGLFQSE